MTNQIYDIRHCKLGEGPLWHPERQQLFWFDILSKQMLTCVNGKADHWQFEECVSAAGWIDYDHLLIASETALFEFEINSGNKRHLLDLEADNLLTRSNDGRADPFGGFWIGTMGKLAEVNAGAIYRYYRGKLEKLFKDITIPNAICFSPNREYAYFTDTPTMQINQQKLDEEGWPIGKPQILIDLTAQQLNADGAVTDQEGNIWCAQWGASRVACYSPDGRYKFAMDISASQASCPAFGGDGLNALFITTASIGLKNPNATDGQTFMLKSSISGLPEPQVKLI